MEHTTLVERIKNGDERALKELFYAHFNTLAAIGRRILGDDQRGKDVAQIIFIKFWEKRHDINIDGEPLPYLKRMTINEAIAQQRTDVRQEGIRGEMHVVSHTEADGEQQVIARDLESEVKGAVDALPDKCREVFKLSRYEELSYREIGDILDISLKTVENHMGRALRQLRRSLGHHLHIFF